MTFAARITQKPTIEKRRTCSNCGRLGHIMTTCTNPEKFHDMIGIEIEGWWWDLPDITRKANSLTGSNGRRDGSLIEISTCTGSDENDPGDFTDPDVEDCEEGCDDCPHPVERRTAPRCSRGKRDCKVCGARGWEFQTRPGSVGEALKQLTNLYPDITSRSAGMHVHMSFKEKTSIALLCSEKFFAYWKERWEAWGTKLNVQGAFWERLRNQNQYCRPNDATADYNPKDLVTGAGRGRADRYKQVNFQSFENHGTVEFRLLPMFQKGNLAVNAVETLVDIVETFLQTYQLDSDIVSPATQLPKSKEDALVMEAVSLDFDIPVREYPKVSAELDMETTPARGESEGSVRMFRYEVADYYSKLAAAATDKISKIADPKRNGIKWDEFDPNPSVPARR